MARRRSNSLVYPRSTDVAAALHNLHDVAALSDSELCGLPEVRERACEARALFAEGIALREVLEAAVIRVIEKLPGADQKVERLRGTLEGVVAGQSIARIARDNSRTREYWSRSYWKRAVELVSQELGAAARSKQASS